jgi:fumarate reductase flavoprotein subunit
VFGGVAGETMAVWVKRTQRAREPDRRALDAAMAACRHPLGQPPGDLAFSRETLWDLLWRDVGILRDANGLARARESLVELDQQLDRTGVDGSDLRFNLTWHDWLNLKSLVLVSRAITEAAAARENSCGAHFREDHPERGPPEQSAYTRISLEEGRFRVTTAPVAFTRVRPGRTLLTV